MSHLSDDRLVLHYYGEDGPGTVAAEQHLETCADCARAYEALSRTLQAVTAPEIVEAPDDIFELRQLLREHLRTRRSPAASLPASLTERRAIALAWLVPVLYPWSLPPLFASAQWAREGIAGAVFMVLTLLWACSGPMVAMLVLAGIGERFDRVSARLRVLGALMATISAPLFLLIARGGERLSWWYAALVVTVLFAVIPWPSGLGSTPRLRFTHRLSALVLGLYILGHIVNQSIAFASVESYVAMRRVMQLATQQPISYTVIVTMVAMQIVSGAAMGLKPLRGGAFARNLQAVSGWYLAVFLLSHVFAGFLLARPAGLPAIAAGLLVPPYSLADGRSVASLPYYLLGVAAFLLHLGVYARLAALAYLTETSVRRLSYAGAIAVAMIVATVGLSMCGIHVLG